MKCDCGYTAFYYTAFTDNKKWNVYKCGHTNVESKKKTKCEMDFREFIEDIPMACDVSEDVDEEIVDTEDPEMKIKKKIREYIHLCEITKYGRGNYIANINHLLRRLNFQLYFAERETLESLKARLENKYVPRVPKKSIYPLNIIEYPDCLKIKTTQPHKKKSTNKKPKSTGAARSFILNTDITEPEEEDKKPKEEMLPSDTETDTEDELDDNTFDVDSYDSGEDHDDYDGGAFSD